GRIDEVRVYNRALSAGEVSVLQTVAANIKWLVADQLGTPRMVFDKTGSLAGTRRHDYLAFGEEWFAGMGGRTTNEVYVADGVRQKFTLKERDTETGLDYFLARYYSSMQGRFTSPDEFTGGPDELYYFVDDASANPTFYADLRKPQSLNKYQYAFNNPLRYVDPDGHDADEADPDPQDPKCQCVTPAHVEQLGNDIDRGLDKAGDAVRKAGTVVITQVLVSAIKIIFGPLPPAPVPNTTEPTTAQPTTATPASPQVQPMPPPPPVEARPHRSRRRKSTEKKHQEGTARKKRDYGGEKGDVVRRPPRRPPRGKTPKGGWPPKPTKPPEPPKPPEPKVPE
ncbi:MAG TPA: RHS repeat-associated core domain-containing protein, partial [Pyrinomonadaceae bacterium]|nr:RHS repeat-associated core domain-containing protein [Pyrinomonadaceae bacterium]